MCSDCGREGCDGSCSYSSRYGQVPTAHERQVWNWNNDHEDDDAIESDGDDDE